MLNEPFSAQVSLNQTLKSGDEAAREEDLKTIL